jgi:hypothetical protein
MRMVDTPSVMRMKAEIRKIIDAETMYYMARMMELWESSPVPPIGPKDPVFLQMIMCKKKIDETEAFRAKYEKRVHVDPIPWKDVAAHLKTFAADLETMK